MRKHLKCGVVILKIQRGKDRVLNTKQCNTMLKALC